MATNSETQRSLYDLIARALWGVVDICVLTADRVEPAPHDFAKEVESASQVSGPMSPPPSAEPDVSPPPSPPWGILSERLSPIGFIRDARRAWADLKSSVLPRLDLLEGEAVKLDIHQAYYRYAVPLWLWEHRVLILILTTILGILIGVWSVRSGASWMFGFAAFLIPLVLFVWVVEEFVHYKQWRLVLTNWRTILYMPAAKSRWLVDDIRLQAGKIQVVDVNFSSNPWWRMFQIFTGSRDLIISISGYGFKANSAEVKDGLIIPDVGPDDIKKLEELVFKK
jgi:hypothetical protein